MIVSPYCWLSCRAKVVGLTMVDTSLRSYRFLPRLHGSCVVYILCLRISNKSLLRHHIPDPGSYLRPIDRGVLAACRGLYRERLDCQRFCYCKSASVPHHVLTCLRECEKADSSQAGGACAFVCCAAGWWILFAIVLESVDFPFQLPVGDLSRLVKPRSKPGPAHVRREDV